MEKKNNQGFVLVETLVVTAFVAGILIYLYLQFTNLNISYEESYKYNTVEGLYALEDVKHFIESDSKAIGFINRFITTYGYMDIYDKELGCDAFQFQDKTNPFSDSSYCKNLLELENIKEIIITYNSIPEDADFSGYSLGFQNFIGKITPEGEQPYRLVAEFNNSTYATVRFGE